jgi:hypothetical protein
MIGTVQVVSDYRAQFGKADHIDVVHGRECPPSCGFGNHQQGVGCGHEAFVVGIARARRSSACRHDVPHRLQSPVSIWLFRNMHIPMMKKLAKSPHTFPLRIQKAKSYSWCNPSIGCKGALCATVSLAGIEGRIGGTGRSSWVRTPAQNPYTLFHYTVPRRYFTSTPSTLHLRPSWLRCRILLC